MDGNTYTSLDSALKNGAKDNEQYERWKEQITLHFEGNLMYYEIDKEARAILYRWERCQIQQSQSHKAVS